MQIRCGIAKPEVALHPQRGGRVMWYLISTKSHSVFHVLFQQRVLVSATGSWIILTRPMVIEGYLLTWKRGMKGGDIYKKSL